MAAQIQGLDENPSLNLLVFNGVRTDATWRNDLRSFDSEVVKTVAGGPFLETLALFANCTAIGRACTLVWPVTCRRRRLADGSDAETGLTICARTAMVAGVLRPGNTRRDKDNP